MTLSYRLATRNAMLDVITSEIGTSGLLRIYSGTPPASAADSLVGNTLLAELALSSSFAGAASAGVLTANSITSDSSADATGTATFFRLTKSDGTAIVQGSVGTSGADLNLTSTSITAGGGVSVTSLSITEGNP